MAQSETQHPRVLVGGFSTISCTREELAQELVADSHEARAEHDAYVPKLVFSSNGQGIALAGRSPRFMEVMSAADIIHADGMPVVFASKRTDAPLPERISTTDFFHDAARAAETNALRFYMLGANEQQNAAAVATIHKLYPNLEVVGRHHGYFDESEDEAICAEIVQAKPDVVWVALGKPKQEEWCLRNRDRLRGVAWLKTCGGLYAFLAGDVPRAPMWMQKAGLEWLFRLTDDPKRLVWRYLWTNPYAMFRLIKFTRRRPVSG